MAEEPEKFVTPASLRTWAKTAEWKAFVSALQNKQNALIRSVLTTNGGDEQERLKEAQKKGKVGLITEIRNWPETMAREIERAQERAKKAAKEAEAEARTRELPRRGPPITKG